MNVSMFGNASSSHAVYFQLQKEPWDPSCFDSSIFFNKTSQTVSEISEIQEQCGKENWDDDGALPVSPLTVSFATLLADAFPTLVDKPTVFPMRTGKIGFQWMAEDKTAVLLSIDGDGRLTFSAVLKNGRKKSETQSFQGSLPGDITGTLLQVGSQSTPYTAIRERR
ncbi:MAG: hypothetical protein IPJ84_01645 [Bdellovibrionales bacterium]|nr:hypothetical protein [Bdellovibrionales bacterium]